eukprot:scaffold21361_cov140-Isochrysis_galbana.AAC.2
MWVPSERWAPAHRMHTRTPYSRTSQSTDGDVHSAHVLLPSRSRNSLALAGTTSNDIKARGAAAGRSRCVCEWRHEQA